jgi:uncharacterized phage protein (TIGR01671 family)
MKIKLKAWYVSGKHWFTDFSLSNDGETVYETGDRYSVADGEVILVQYTGLKDKNGKEIYECDIIDYGHSRYKEVIFFNGSFCLKGLESIPWLLPMYPVIGNVYENPELIKQ